MRVLLILKHALKQDKYKGRVSLSYDRLVVNGVHYKLSDLANLPVDISPAKACEKEDENTIRFKGIHSPFSDYNKANVKHIGEQYNCTGQFIQSKCTEMFDDDFIKQKIMRSENPYDMK